jgi:ABC-type amino acid transport system permease subunit
VKDRSTVELMILAFTLTVALSIMLTGATVAIIEIRDPTVDTSRITDMIVQIITTILGALLGLIAGRSEGPRLPPTPKDGP